MNAAISRTGSGSLPVRAGFISGLSRIPVSFSVQDLSSRDVSGATSPRISLNIEASSSPRGIRRCASESDVFLSGMKGRKKIGSRPAPERIPEEEIDGDLGLSRSSWTFTEAGLWGYAGDWPGSSVSFEQIGFPGGGINQNRKYGGGDGNGGNQDSTGRRQIGAYYQEMLKTNPTDSLLLRNYAKYLHEVEKDAEKAEEYYGRAILASPGDGEVLSSYGKLIWEKERDQDRAKSYFDQAVYASPEDCMVLGSYANFMWEAEEEEEQEEAAKIQRGKKVLNAAMAGAY